MITKNSLRHGSIINDYCTEDFVNYLKKNLIYTWNFRLKEVFKKWDIKIALIGLYTDFWRQEFEFAQGLTTEKKLT